MAGQGTVAEVRVFRTVDGKLVGEHDPRGAYLAYAVGDEVPAERVEEYDKVSKGFSAEVDYLALREQVVNHVPAGPDGDAVYIHHDMVTTLADEAQEVANLPEDVRVEVRRAVEGEGVVIADRRVSYTEDRDELVDAADARAAFLAYIPGDIVKAKDVDMYNDLAGDDDKGDDDATDKEAADKEAADVKARAVAPPNKARTAATVKAADK